MSEAYRELWGHFPAARRRGRLSTAGEAAEILDRFNLRQPEPKRPTASARRLPTVDDYVALGVNREAAERAVAERQAKPGRGR